jgi:hypothetical protein
MLALFNQMYSDVIIRDQKKHGLVVCIQKKTAPTQPADYRPTTFLNTDFKILARIIPNRLRPILDELLYPSQHCVAGRGIFDAVATIRDATAYAEMSHAPLSILSLDFTEAFDRIVQRHLFSLLTEYGVSTKFIAFIQNTYNHAHSSIHINKHTTGPIRTRY